MVLFMSHKTEFWLKVFLKSQDDRVAVLEICHSISDDNFNVLVKAINKIRREKVDINPLVKFLKNNDLDNFINNKWSIQDIDFIVHRGQLIELLESHKNGLSIEEIHDCWSHITRSSIGDALFKLHLDGLIIPVRDAGKNGGYILKEYYKKQKLDSPSSSPSQSPKKEQFTKAESKQIRKNIINKANNSDICEAGFKPVFVESLSDKEKKYLNSISNLAIKLMRTEVAKS